MLAPLLLAVALGQACPLPLSVDDPPPCAAKNAAGCLPGYTPIRDRHGRLIYVCATSSRAVPPAPAPLGAPVAAAPLPPPQDRGRARVALVLTPGRTTDPAVGVHGGRDLDRNAAAAALELRGREGGARVRLQFQDTEIGRVGEVGLKYDFLDRTPLRPFIGLALGASSVEPDTRWRASGSAFAGIDLYLDRNAFLTAEIQGRRFATNAGRALDLTGRWQTSALVGIGLYL